MTDQTVLLKLLLPPVSYNPSSIRLSAELAAEGNMLNAIAIKSIEIINSITPFHVDSLLENWECVLDLKNTGQSLTQRRDLVLAKLAEYGGLSIPYFTQIARSLGYDIRIDEIQPFYTGINRTGDRIYTHDIIYMWRVQINSTSKNPTLEAIFNDLKPAHTAVGFTYGGLT